MYGHGDLKLMVNDHHVHTRHSKCVRESYDLDSIISAHQHLGFSYACVTDHVHRDGEGGFLDQQLAMRDVLTAKNPEFRVFVGFELSLVDFEGHVARPDTARRPDGPLLFADHWIPGTAISMDDLPGSATIIKEMHDNDPRNLLALYRDVAGMYIHAMERANTLDVLAHPFDTFLRAANFDGRLLDVFEPVCEACQHHGVAIEINEKALERYHEVYTKVAPIHEDCLPPDEFYHSLLRTASRFNVQFSAGSDAHAVRDIGRIDRVRSCMASLGITGDRLLQLDARRCP